MPTVPSCSKDIMQSRIRVYCRSQIRIRKCMRTIVTITKLVRKCSLFLRDARSGFLSLCSADIGPKYDTMLSEFGLFGATFNDCFARVLNRARRVVRNKKQKRDSLFFLASSDLSACEGQLLPCSRDSILKIK